MLHIVAVKKPILMLTLLISLGVLGAISFLRLPFSLYPENDNPKIYVNASCPYPNAEQTEQYITRRLEDAFSGLSGLTGISSSSNAYFSTIELSFSAKTNMPSTTLLLRDRLESIKKSLPEADLSIQKWVPEEFEVKSFMDLGFYGDGSEEQIRDFINKDLFPNLASIKGVKAISVDGLSKTFYQITIKEEMQKFITPQMIAKELYNRNGDYYVSNIPYADGKINLKIKNSLSSYQSLSELIIKTPAGDRLLKDIATIEKITETPFIINRCNGTKLYLLHIQKDSMANAVQLAKKIDTYISNIKFGEGIKVIKIYDESDPIKKELGSLFFKSGFSLFFIIIILLFYLHRIKSSIHIMLSVLLSILATFFAMYFTNTGLNLLSLAGLTFGFGIIVDNSIVVYESIGRKRNLGLLKAVKDTVKETALPLVACTITTLVVFLPFLYLQNEAVYYRPFVKTIVFSLTASLLISFSFLPLTAHTNIVLPKEKTSMGAVRLLVFFLRHKSIWISLVILLFVGSIFLFVFKVSRFSSGNKTNSRITTISLASDYGTDSEIINRYALRIEEALKNNNLIDFYITSLEQNSGTIKIMYKENVTNEMAAGNVANLAAVTGNMGGISITVIGFGIVSFQNSFGNISGQHCITISGYDYDGLKDLANNLMTFMKKNSMQVKKFSLDSREFGKDYSYKYSLDMTDFPENRQSKKEIASLIASGLRELTVITDIGKQLTNIKIGYKNKNVAYLNKSYINMENIGKPDIEPIPDRILRKDKKYTLYLHYDYNGAIGRYEKFIAVVSKTFAVPDGYHLKFSSSDKKEKDYSLIIALFAAVLLVFLVLSALFESFLIPGLIMLSVPLAFMGVSFIFYFTNQVFGESANLGLILLAGISVNNSIMMLYYIQELYIKNKNLNLAVLRGVKDRYRPIMMTTLTTVCGLLPMLFSKAGDDFWKMLSLSTIGGMLFSCFFVMFFLPVIFDLVEYRRKRNFNSILGKAKP